MRRKSMSQYEKQALEIIRQYKNPKVGWFGNAMTAVMRPINSAGDLINKIPGAEITIQKTIGGVINLLNDGAQWTVRQDSIHDVFRAEGHEIKNRKDLYQLDLEEIDKAIGYLAAKYKALSLIEGVATGTLGIAGIPIDIPALLGMNLRAIGEYATYCGFDISIQHERMFVLQILSSSADASAAAKHTALAQLAKIAQEAAKKKAWKDLEKHAMVKVIQKVAEKLGIQLTKAKLAQLIPALGGAIAGGVNSWFTACVCESAYFLYRERFLAEKYGAEIIKV
jgi:EcsC family protein